MQDACSRLSTTLSSSQLSPPPLPLETTLIPSHITALLDSAEVNLTTRLSNNPISHQSQKLLCSKATNTPFELENYAKKGENQGKTREFIRFHPKKGSNSIEKRSFQSRSASHLHPKAKPKAPKQIKLDLQALTDISLAPDPYISPSLSCKVPVYSLNLVSVYRKTRELRPVRSPDGPVSQIVTGNNKRKPPSSPRS